MVKLKNLSVYLQAIFIIAIFTAENENTDISWQN